MQISAYQLEPKTVRFSRPLRSRPVISAARETTEALVTLRAYRASLLPFARQELAEWRRVAAEIPDPILRRAAVTALTDKAGNAEATAVLAVLAPPPSRRAVLRISSALQVAIDYLDVLGEEDSPDPLKDGLQLHRALSAALSPGATAEDWYRHHPRKEDGGYLDRLVAGAQTGAADLPAGETVLPLARRAAKRCGEGQSYTHAAAHGAVEELETWSSALPAPAGFMWWEVAAGASSSVAAHALLALAANPTATEADAAAVDAAYFPAIGALTVILDDLVDREEDLAAGEHSYLDYYPSPEVAAERLALVAEEARRLARPLQHARRHRAILAGVLAYYLAAPGADAGLPRAGRRRLVRSAGPAARPLTAFLRLSR